MDLLIKNIDYGIKHNLFKLEDFKPNDECVACHSQTNIYFISQLQRTLCKRCIKGLTKAFIGLMELPELE